MMGPSEEHSAIWEGISLRIKWAPRWCELPDLDFAIAHLTVESVPAERLPISETGFKSDFLQREEVEEYGGPVEYVKAWLDHDAGQPAWKSYLEESRQGSLF